MGETYMVLIRSVITFVSLLIFSRILGKGQISQMTFFEYITGITIGSIAGEMTTDLHVPPWPMYVGLMTWTTLALATQYITISSRWTGKMIEGQPTIVIQNGKILEGNLRKMRMRVDDLMSLLRIEGIFDLTTVEFAIYEPSGEVSVLKRSQDRAVTPADLKISTKYEGMGIDLIVDGEVIEQNLRNLHLNRAWLRERLLEKGIQSTRDVLLAVLDSQGGLYVDTYDDKVSDAHKIGDYPGPN